MAIREMEIIKEIAAAALGIGIVVWVLVCAVEVEEIRSQPKTQRLNYRMACDGSILISMYNYRMNPEKIAQAITGQVVPH